MLTAYRSSLSLSATSIFRPPPLLASCKFLQGPTGLLLLRKRLKCTSEDLEDLTRSDHVLGGFYSQMVGSHLAVYFKKMLLPTATDGHPLFAWTNPLGRVLDPSPLITAVSRQGTKEGIKFSYTPFVAPSPAGIRYTADGGTDADGRRIRLMCHTAAKHVRASEVGKGDMGRTDARTSALRRRRRRRGRGRETRLSGHLMKT